MSGYGAMELPQLPDGRPYITHQLLVEQPHLREFVNRFSNFWRMDLNRDVYIGGYVEDTK